MGVIPVKAGIICTIDNNVECPHCTRPMEWHEFEDELHEAEIPFIEIQCPGCKRTIGVTVNFQGVCAVELESD